MKFKELKKAAIYITPVFPKIETKRYKFTISRVMKFVLIYSLVLSLAVITALTFTPARKLIYFVEYEKIEKEAERIKVLEDHIMFLSKELKNISSTNKRLDFLYTLGTNDTIDTSATIYDTLTQPDSMGLQLGGNILIPIMKLLGLEIGDSALTKVSFIRPSKGFVIKHYNPDEGHLGIDFAVKKGTPVYASAGGVVLFADYTVSDGYMIMISHSSDYVTVYKHCSSLLKKSRDKVLQGELIGLSGNSGKNTTGPHLHFEIWKDGKVIDPEKILINI